MEIKFKQIPTNVSALNMMESQNLVMGFTENGFELKDLERIFPANKLAQLKQIHSNIIVPASDVALGMEGDGLLLREKGVIAVIKTADCVPLFFWNDSYSIAGILHIGWKGLLYGIEEKLLELLSKEKFPLDQFHFATGPAIESECYEVGPDLYEAFAPKHYREDIFRSKENGKFRLDIKHGISLSLTHSGVDSRRITHSPLCTYCMFPRFPSYRRNGKTGQRIFNFIFLR
jgi:YfiH family protein